ncbi:MULTISPECIES: Pls/PosA family non-ribosomal peptide synthetase [unclassified Pseudonocardia]|uniref:Pls/PosA family non-ribosomal peptide synthetase n=1 Tax=unclassified Pseudonocardia TaxID=2619320 RepID=UPI00094AB070|nr:MULTISPECIES: Pls/PosA family non-ribosomal peptide synthetase [unclassified Pseudonocardia]
MSQFGPGTIPLRPGSPPRDPFGGVTVRLPAAPGRHATHGSVLTGAPPAPPRTLWDVFTRTVADHPHAPALDTGGVRLDYAGLRAAVERTAARLAACGVGRGDRVGIRVPSGTPHLYVAILAVLRRGAAYVPVDADDPHERARTVFTEAAVCAVVEAGGRIVPGPVHPRRVPSRGPDVRDDAWVIFTSGSTGTPKGVAVTHRSAAAFVDAEARLFARDRPLGPGDRVLAGLSVAFDASCEEMWLAWRHGACLVPVPRALVRSGAEFGDRLVELGITVVSTVPTLAALWTAEQLRAVRLLILGGEACSEPLAHRLARACPEVWNTYGPTEATVVSCAARLTEDGPVRIGLPLAGWRLAVLDPATGAPVGSGEVGELVIAGVGTARYLDRDRFSPVPALGPQRAYRSGDLVRAAPEGLSFVGRADGQVKIRGFRVELSEIESVLADLPGIAAAAVTVHEVRPSVPELVAYYCTGPGLRIDDHEVAAGLRARLPAHMVPACYEHLPALPTTTSGKVDRAALPAPSGRGTASSAPVVAPATATEAELAALLGESLGLAEVSVQSHLVDDLRADSLALAQFAALVRHRRGPSCPVGMRVLYQHPTVRSLAALLDRTGPGTVGTTPAVAPAAPPPVGRARHLLCGTVQVLVLLLGLAAGAVVAWADIEWMDLATGLLDLFERSGAALVATFLLLTLVPVLAKWLLVGRWRAGEIPLWSAAHLRFWVVATLVRTSPMVLFAGSPLYLLHLRALGARVGRGAVVFSRTVPVCTDLISIGDGAVVRSRSSFTGYRVERGRIVTGPVTIGRGAVVSDATVLDIDSVVGDDAQLGHASSLPRGARIPDGTRAHGSPAVPTTSDFRGPDPARCSTARRAVFATVQLLTLFLAGPATVTLAVAVLDDGPRVTALVDGRDPGDLLALAVSPLGLGLSLAAGAAALVAGLLVVTLVPRLLWPLLRPGRVHRLYGAAYWCHRTVARLSNVPLFVQLFGDSSFVVGYLRRIGYRIARGGQTGSNVGADIAHEVPNLVTIGPNTMLSDGVFLRTAEFTSTSFRTVPVGLGADCFLGNVLTVPAGDRIGDGCLVGTKTMIPTDGPRRRDVGLLGSPAFEIPRARPEDPRLAVTGERLRRRLAAKDRHNLATMALFLLVTWVRLHVLLTVGLVAAGFLATAGPLAIAGGALAGGLADLAVGVLVERAATGFRRLQPQHCSIYDRYFWWHERFWKLSIQPSLLNGTPLKPLVWRLLGVRVGRRVFDDGAAISEKTLVAIGDDTVLGAGVILQAHSMEDGVFKADHIRIGDGCVLGAGVFVHYDTVVGDGAVLAPDSFLMKGERVGAGGVWGGNPAAPVTTVPVTTVPVTTVPGAPARGTAAPVPAG